jgi:hypothetical protein
MKYLIGFIIIIIGFFIVWKTNWFLDMTGRIAFMEDHLQAYGGTQFFYKLLGVFIIFCAFLYMTGILQSIVVGILDPLVGIMGNSNTGP